jgi:hypothetical protein
MKSVLGKLLIFLILFFVQLMAQDDYTWSATASKKSLHVNEAVMIKYVCKFKDDGYQYVIDFKPPQDSENYTLHLLSQKDSIVDNATQREFSFVLFFKKASVQSLKFDALMRLTTKESIKNRNIGRDNMQEAAYTDKKVSLPALEFNVNDSKDLFSGTLSLESSISSFEVKAYEPTHLEIKVSGVGNLDLIKPFELNIADVKIFKTEPIKNYTLTKDGFSGTITQKFSFVSQMSFTIPELRVKYFDITAKKEIELYEDAKNISVKEGYKKEELLDLKEIESESFEFKVEWIYYFFTFVAGIFVGRISLKKVTKERVKSDFATKVKNAKDKKELLMLLVITDSQKYKTLIDEAEKSNLSLSEIKKRVS